MNQTNPTPPRPPQPRKNPDTEYYTRWIIRMVLLSVVVVLTMLVVYYNYVRQDPGPGPTTYLYNKFLDVDGDGDLDYLNYGEAVINCAGSGCVNHVPAAGGPENPLFDPPPTPQVYPRVEVTPAPN
jgi:hypothetical protein